MSQAICKVNEKRERDRERVKCARKTIINVNSSEITQENMGKTLEYAKNRMKIDFPRDKVELHVPIKCQTDRQKLQTSIL